jgi:hypothetical protein
LYDDDDDDDEEDDDDVTAADNDNKLLTYCTAMAVLVGITQYTTLFVTLFYLRLC